MRCLRCGYCCVQHDVVIVSDPDKGIAEGNVEHKPTGVRCRHLRGEPGRCSCAVHDRPWYGETPCFSHGQIERRADDVCRMGEYVLEKRRRSCRGRATWTS